jgi:hypothetical protein
MPDRQRPDPDRVVVGVREWLTRAENDLQTVAHERVTPSRNRCLADLLQRGA